MEPRKCKICGKEFKPHVHNQIYCGAKCKNKSKARGKGTLEKSNTSKQRKTRSDVRTEAKKQIPDWPFSNGDQIQLELYKPESGNGWRQYKGPIVSITPTLLVIDTGRYRVSAARWAWWAGYARIEKVIAKEGGH